MKSILFTAIVMMSSSIAEAQDSNPFWVIKRNVNATTSSILRVYNSNNDLIHEEVINGKALDVTVRKDRKRIARRVKEILRSHALVSRAK